MRVWMWIFAQVEKVCRRQQKLGKKALLLSPMQTGMNKGFQVQVVCRSWTSQKMIYFGRNRQRRVKMGNPKRNAQHKIYIS